MAGATEESSGTSGTSPLEFLVQDLNAQAKTFTRYLRGSGLPEPSFERDAPIHNLPSHAPERVQAARYKLMDNALQIFQLLAGPGEYVENAFAGVSIPQRPQPLNCNPLTAS
jgi:6-hydroxytryprostatin B O-methyltransferase